MLILFPVTNFVQRPLPHGSTTGASNAKGQSGALGFGQRVSYGLSTFKQFFVYTTPLFGAYVADAHWGRFKTINVAIAVAFLGHILFIIAALPPVIAHPTGSLATFIIGMIFFGVGTGGFKPNISPLIVEQLLSTKMVVRKLPSGERVIVDPAVTASRVYMYYYFLTNLGALSGVIGMAYTEKYVGFWAAWLVPTVLLLVSPAVMLWGRHRYRRTPPEGSVLIKAILVWILMQKGCWSLNPVTTWKRLHDGGRWEMVKPSNIPPSERPAWMTFNDEWVEEVRRGFAACAVFMWYPLFFLCYNQINHNLISQSALMQLHGLPNDFLTSIDPITLCVLIPLFDQVLYPFLRMAGVNFSPIKRITTAFYIGAAAMVWAAVLQYYIYQKSPCGYNANTCEMPAPIHIAAQTGAFILIAISEIFGTITLLEYSYSKAPKNMKSLVQAVALFTNAIAAAIGEALVPLTDDPWLVWNYAIPAILAFIAGTAFCLQLRYLDHEEDRLNMLPIGKMIANKGLEAVDISNEVEIDEVESVHPSRV